VLGIIAIFKLPQDPNAFSLRVRIFSGMVRFSIEPLYTKEYVPNETISSCKPDSE
jgi:hypothetical protein